MPTRKHTSGRRSEPRLFRCTGFGDCDMVFTRSEHLARHARKHTGEKPFKCIVPGCSRMFSRFDNMMQHTQTHTRQRKRLSVSTPSKKETHYAANHDRRNTIHGSRPSVVSHRAESVHSPSQPSVMPKRMLPLPTPSDVHLLEDAFYYPRHPQAPYLPVSPLQKDSAMHPPFSNDYGSTVLPPFDKRRSSLSSAPSPTLLPRLDYWGNSGSDWQQSTLNRRYSISTDSSCSSFSSHSSHTDIQSNSDGAKRRLSVVDLHTPIKHLQGMSLGDECFDPKEDDALSNHSSHSQDPPAQDTKTITSDEYEALQGFGKFHSESVLNKAHRDSLENRSGTPPRNFQSPNMASRVCAFRRNVLPIRESCQRPAR